MQPKPLSLKVLAAYARDIGNGIVRIDHGSMDLLGVNAGDTVDVIGLKDGMSAKCFPLLPSDENQGITRLDPEIREAIGASVEDTITLRNISPVPVENFAPEDRSSIPMPIEENAASAEKVYDESVTPPSVFVLSGSCIDFAKERPKLMDFLTNLEAAAHLKSKGRCYSDGKKALGWDFFLLEVEQTFVEKLRDLYPEIDKQEAGTTEERFALWLNKQMKKKALEFRLKLTDVPQEKVGGFRLNPEHFRDESDLGDLR
ncbi:MAG TPA: hypothetical protein VJM08_00420 [Anaerolineales bacterium]|nr:hypothetical protein [Anaerolineales bacterium]